MAKGWIGGGGGAWIVDPWLVYVGSALLQGQPRSATHSTDLAVRVWIAEPANRAILRWVRGDVIRRRLNDPKTALEDLTASVNPSQRGWSSVQWRIKTRALLRRPPAARGRRRSRRRRPTRDQGRRRTPLPGPFQRVPTGRSRTCGTPSSPVLVESRRGQWNRRSFAANPRMLPLKRNNREDRPVLSN